MPLYGSYQFVYIGQPSFDKARDRRCFAPASSPRDSSRALLSLFRECCVVDVRRDLHPHSTFFTWLRPDESFLSRIDLLGCLLAWLHHVKACDIILCPYSDHAAVLLLYPILVPLPRGPGRWRFNVSLLKEAGFVEEVEAFWTAWALKKTPSSLQSWLD